MAITIKDASVRPPTVKFFYWEKATDAADVAAWCKGRVTSATTILIPDPFEPGDENATQASLGDVIVLTEGGRFLPLPRAQFLVEYTEKV